MTGFLQASAPGKYSYSRRGEFLRCPWHGWEFDVKTGQSWWNPAQMRVQSYEVNFESGIDIQKEKGPYVVETYPVSIEKQYVVVEVPA